MKDEETLESLEVNDGGKLYYKDLGKYNNYVKSLGLVQMGSKLCS